jgi:RHS repeat-associated protein
LKIERLIQIVLHAVIPLRPGKRGAFDEYRYDALGRRVFARSRKVGLNCPTSAVDCAPTATRTVWDGDRILYEIRAKGGEIIVTDTTGSGGGGGCHPECELSFNHYLLLRSTVELASAYTTVDTIPDPAMESDGPSGGPNGLAYGVVGYTYGLSIDEPITITRTGSTNSSVPNPAVVFPHTGWRGMLSLITNADGNRNDCPIGGNSCIPIDVPGANATVDRGRKVEAEPLSWFGSLASNAAEQSGLQYKRNRFYDPKRGQFTQEDPIGLGGGLNLYGFASGDPVNRSDPFGLLDDVYQNEYGKEVGRTKKGGPDNYFLVTGGETYRLDYKLTEASTPYTIVRDPAMFDTEARALATEAAPDYTNRVSVAIHSLPGGTLDFKRLLPDRSLWNAGDGLYTHKHAVGNAAWGFYMKQHGFSLETALNGASAQGKSVGGEDRLDQRMIKRGYKIR